MAILILNSVTLALTLLYVCIVAYLCKGWRQIPAYGAGGQKSVRTKVSVLIAARNEEKNIGRTLEAIVAQNYPPELFECIVVDDHSTDRTAEIIASFHNNGVQLIRLQEDEKLNSYKKKAITVAIHQSTGDLIVATDADCYMGPMWLRTIVSYYELNQYKLISSPVVYFEEKSWFERLQTLEFLYLIGLGAAGIGLGRPSTCNGANLAYRKDVFMELKGFQGIDDLASGDDELFLHKVAERYPEGVGFCKSHEAIVYTEAKLTLSAFVRQRRRWASKSTRYKNKAIVALGVLIWFFNLTVLCTGVLSLFSLDFLPVFLMVIGVKLLIELLFLRPLTKFAGRKELLWKLPILTLLHPLYMVYIGIAGNAGKYQWKGRSVR